MWARSHTSGLMIATCWLSTSASDSGSTSAKVLSPPSVRASVSGGAAVVFEGTELGPRAGYGLLNAASGRHAARLAPHVDHLADRGGAPGDPRIERPDHELAAPGLELLELAHLDRKSVGEGE